MLKFLFFIMTFPLLFTSQTARLPDCISKATYFSAQVNGEEIVFESESDILSFNQLLAEAFYGAIQVPAPGVSLHDETVEARKEGVWIELIFDGTQTCTEMAYDTLLFKVDRNMYGVNLFRGNNGKYEGRCFYLNLQNNFDSLYEFLVNL